LSQLREEEKGVKALVREGHSPGTGYKLNKRQRLNYRATEYFQVPKRLPPY
jgi:hypothetical protein